MKWESPWGLSYPGWHLECSTMGRRFLGEEFDIHTGGVDHIPTHHENEIAQSKGATGKIPAHVWMHCEYLQVDGGKMSKSLGNTYTISQLQEKGISPLAFKLFCFTAHYRNKLNFTFEGAYGAQKALERLYDSYVKNVNGADDVEEDVIKEYEEKFLSYINDDMNMPGAEKYLVKFKQNDSEELPAEIKKLVEERKNARAEKNWAKSDEIRDKIISLGYSIKDTKDGIIVKKEI